MFKDELSILDCCFQKHFLMLTGKHQAHIENFNTVEPHLIKLFGPGGVWISKTFVYAK